MPRSVSSAYVMDWPGVPSSCGGVGCAEMRTTDAPDVQPDALFVELTAPATGKTEMQSIDCAWEMELELGAGVVLRLRRGAAC